MFNKKRIFVFFVFILLLFFLMTFGGSGKGAKSYRTVTFMDGYDDSVIETVKIEVGKDADVPEEPVHEGCDFSGWYDKNDVKIDNFTGITENLTVYAECNWKYFKVTFYDTVAKNVIKVEDVKYGDDATAPKARSHNGYAFDGWSRGYTNVKSDFQVNALYTSQVIAKYYSVKFYDNETSELIKTETVKEGLSATFPEIPTHKNKVYDHFEGDYTNVT